MVDKYEKRRVTQIHMEAISKRAKVHEQIHARCRQCGYGKENGNGTICRHPWHPGHVGGYGTEWALACSEFVGRDKTDIVELPQKFGFEATFVDGQKRRCVSFNASTAKVEMQFARMQEGGRTYNELEIVCVEVVKDLDAASA